MTDIRCRFCGSELVETFINLGMSPLSNAYVKQKNLNKTEHFYPLHAYLCSSCFLVQLEEFESPDNIFSDYAYFSSYSKSWMAHMKKYSDRIINRLNLSSKSQVVEVASNDGYLLKFFKNRGIQVLGIEPAKNVARSAVDIGIPTITEFFGKSLALKLKDNNKLADLLIGNNVLAHVPDLNDFVLGLKTLLKPNGVITMEFPHVLSLIQNNQFDTIYHEHFSYFSFLTVKKIFNYHGLDIYDVEELSTHGGSLRIYCKHVKDNTKTISNSCNTLLTKELDFGLNKTKTYTLFQTNVQKLKRIILTKLIELKEKGCSIVGYGAPAKGNTLLNFCGIATDFIDYTVDKNPCKQNLYLPGTHIPIFAPNKILQTKPDYVLILPWNLKNEIMHEMNCIREWGGRFITLIPKVEVI